MLPSRKPKIIPPVKNLLRSLAPSLRYGLLAVAFCLGLALQAQAPGGFRFQAVARDADNDVLATENIAVRVSLLAGGPNGPVNYSERHEVITTDLGIFDLHIGDGTVLNGNLGGLDWGGTNFYLRIEVDPDGGTNYVYLGAFWHVAGLPSTSAPSARLNFYFSNASGSGDRMTLTGDGKLGINGTPSARMEIFQRSQLVGTGLRFDDGTANADWDITHGFGLRFHYGGTESADSRDYFLPAVATETRFLK